MSRIAKFGEVSPAEAQYAVSQGGQSQWTGTATPFQTAAPVYAEFGLRVFPTGGDDGKKPLIKRWRKIGFRAVSELATKFPNANVGFLDGDANGVSRIDVDDPDLIGEAIERFGDTPIKVGTPSGGLHLWYRPNGERRKIGLEGKKIDVLGKGGFGVAPPSKVPGKGDYRFLEGIPDLIPKLPRIRPGSLPPEVYSRRSPASHFVGFDTPSIGQEKIGQGSRTNALFTELRRIQFDCDTIDELAFRAAGINEALFDPPLSDNEVMRQVRGVWQLRLEGRCFVSGARFAVIELEEGVPLYKYPPAMTLWHYLKSHHAQHHDFAVSPRALAGALGQSWKTVSNARDFLVDRGYLIQTRQGGRGEGDFHLFRFGDRLESQIYAE
jgi:hypothetical protein